MNIDAVIKKVYGCLGAPGAPKMADNVVVSFGILRTMMLVAAVDGEVSRTEMSLFWKSAMELTGLHSTDLKDLWTSSLTSAGYLALQAKILSEAELVAEFLRLAEADFVKKLIPLPAAERKRAYRCLEAMANADGCYTAIEKTCIAALVNSVNEVLELRAATRAIRI